MRVMPEKRPVRKPIIVGGPFGGGGEGKRGLASGFE